MDLADIVSSHKLFQYYILIGYSDMLFDVCVLLLLCLSNSSCKSVIK